jgi:hypothetical protein
VHQQTANRGDSTQSEEEKKKVEEGLAVRGRPAMMKGGFIPLGYSKRPYICFVKGSD